MSELDLSEIKAYEKCEKCEGSKEGSEENEGQKDQVVAAPAKNKEESVISRIRHVENNVEGNNKGKNKTSVDKCEEDAKDKTEDGKNKEQDDGEEESKETCKVETHANLDAEGDRREDVETSLITLQDRKFKKRKASCLTTISGPSLKRSRLTRPSSNKDHSSCAYTKDMSLLCQQMQKTADFMAQLLQGLLKNQIKPTNLATSEESTSTTSESQNPSPNAETFISDNIHFLQRPKYTGLKPILIDGPNIAMAHGLNRRFSVQGLRICIDYFCSRGHQVFAFIPAHRLKVNGSDDQAALMALQDEGFICVTSSWDADGCRFFAYDDRILLQAAAAMGGVVVSRDQFRDLRREDSRFVELLKKALLMPTFVGDLIVFPQDPLGKHGPKLERFLKYP